MAVPAVPRDQGKPSRTPSHSSRPTPSLTTLASLLLMHAAALSLTLTVAPVAAAGLAAAELAAAGVPADLMHAASISHTSSAARQFAPGRQLTAEHPHGGIVARCPRCQLISCSGDVCTGECLHHQKPMPCHPRRLTPEVPPTLPASVPPPVPPGMQDDSVSDEFVMLVRS